MTDFLEGFVNRECKVCDLVFKNQQHYQIHIQGQLHAERVSLSEKKFVNSSKSTSATTVKFTISSIPINTYCINKSSVISTSSQSQKNTNPSSFTSNSAPYFTSTVTTNCSYPSNQTDNTAISTNSFQELQQSLQQKIQENNKKIELLKSQCVQQKPEPPPKVSSNLETFVQPSFLFQPPMLPSQFPTSQPFPPPPLTSVSNYSSYYPSSYNQMSWFSSFPPINTPLPPFLPNFFNNFPPPTSSFSKPPTTTFSSTHNSNHPPYNPSNSVKFANQTYRPSSAKSYLQITSTQTPISSHKSTIINQTTTKHSTLSNSFLKPNSFVNTKPSIDLVSPFPPSLTSKPTQATINLSFSFTSPVSKTITETKTSSNSYYNLTSFPQKNLNYKPIRYVPPNVTSTPSTTSSSITLSSNIGNSQYNSSFKKKPLSPPDLSINTSKPSSFSFPLPPKNKISLDLNSPTPLPLPPSVRNPLSSSSEITFRPLFSSKASSALQKSSHSLVSYPKKFYESVKNKIKNRQSPPFNSSLNANPNLQFSYKSLHKQFNHHQTNLPRPNEDYSNDNDYRLIFHNNQLNHSNFKNPINNFSFNKPPKANQPTSYSSKITFIQPRNSTNQNNLKNKNLNSYSVTNNYNEMKKERKRIASGQVGNPENSYINQILDDDILSSVRLFRETMIHMIKTSVSDFPNVIKRQDKKLMFSMKKNERRLVKGVKGLVRISCGKALDLIKVVQSLDDRMAHVIIGDWNTRKERLPDLDDEGYNEEPQSCAKDSSEVTQALLEKIVRLIKSNPIIFNSVNFFFYSKLIENIKLEVPMKRVRSMDEEDIFPNKQLNSPNFINNYRNQSFHNNFNRDFDRRRGIRDVDQRDMRGEREEWNYIRYEEEHARRNRIEPPFHLRRIGMPEWRHGFF